MILAQAEEIFGRALAPFPLGEFLDGVLGKRYIKVAEPEATAAKAYLGGHPEQVLLADFQRLAPRIGCHAAAPSGPPPAIEPVASATAFAAKIADFHARGYTVRLPEIRSLTAELDALIRAMEVVFQQAVKVEAFWSRGDAHAPSHHDDYDILVVHLHGRKRWYISTTPSELPNAWNKLPATSPAHRFDEVMVDVGDVLYLPRGTTHRVDAISDSIHLSIGFVPLTLSEAIAACLDHLSDNERLLRETVAGNLGLRIAESDFGDLPDQVRAGLKTLLACCESDSFIRDSLQRRSARVISGLDKLRATGPHGVLAPSTRLRHNALAAAHVGANGGRIDFAYPGGHQLIHPAVEEGVSFIARTPEFSIAEIPGAVGDDIRLALAEKFVSCGFLEVADAS